MIYILYWHTELFDYVITLLTFSWRKAEIKHPPNVHCFETTYVQQTATKTMKCYATQRQKTSFNKPFQNPQLIKVPMGLVEHLTLPDITKTNIFCYKNDKYK